ncbi:sulfotransferase family cytosolic 2B member 1 isoform X2 [Oreochromis niloticus]|uniref:sulfotransferase family cytosolic 2B member 1 isoform X2 n=1 Tax=Oreochromis niloticus TaxID=8128 RepID=UPI0003941D46|nr:sulfotransferase family cytosolic 2B member 1 isoform X2 [Oreochromis niloticus]
MSLSEEMYLRYHGLIVPKETHSYESLEFAQGFKFEDDDVLAVTYPKSGTIWMQEILPLVLNGGDLTPIHTIPNWERVPWLEEKQLARVVAKLASPRALVSHLPYNFMPPSFCTSKAKVIYLMRNPKDIMVSSYYFHQMASFLEDPGTFDEFMDTFLEGKVLFGKWTDHVKSWRNSELGDRIMYITYEEMVQTRCLIVHCIVSVCVHTMRDRCNTELPLPPQNKYFNSHFLLSYFQLSYCALK